MSEPREDLLRRERVQLDDGAAPVVGVLAAPDELVFLEVARELARCGERQPDLGGDLADRALALRRHVGEDGDVARPERRGPADEREQLRRRPAPVSQPVQDPPERAAQLRDLFGNSYHRITVTLGAGKEVSVHMCGGGHHHHGRGRRGFGFPNREQLVDRLQRYQQHLEGELRNVQELLERLGDREAPAQQV